MKTVMLVFLLQTFLLGQVQTPNSSTHEPLEIIFYDGNLLATFKPLDSETGYIALAKTLSMQIKQEVSKLTLGGTSPDKKQNPVNLSGTWHVVPVLRKHKTFGYLMETRIARHVARKEERDCSLEQEKWFSADNTLQPFTNTENLARQIANKIVEFLANSKGGTPK